MWSFSPKRFFQGLLRDAKEVCQPVFGFVTRVWYFLGPRLTNRAMVAMVLADAAVITHFHVSQATIDLTSFVIMALANLLTPLSRPGAPQRIPPPPAPVVASINPHNGPPPEHSEPYLGQAYHWDETTAGARWRPV
jgi:hypothetical protein